MVRKEARRPVKKPFHLSEQEIVACVCEREEHTAVTVARIC